LKLKIKLDFGDILLKKKYDGFFLKKSLKFKNKSKISKKDKKKFESRVDGGLSPETKNEKLKKFQIISKFFKQNFLCHFNC
jgi:hypothetical protein